MAVLCKSLILFRGLYPNTCLCSMESMGSPLCSRRGPSALFFLSLRCSVFQNKKPTNFWANHYHLEEILAILRPPLINWFLYHLVNGEMKPDWQANGQNNSKPNLFYLFFMAVLPYGQLVTCETFVAKCSLRKYLEALQFLLVEDLNLCFWLCWERSLSFEKNDGQVV